MESFSNQMNLLLVHSAQPILLAPFKGVWGESAVSFSSYFYFTFNREEYLQCNCNLIENELLRGDIISYFPSF